MEGGIIQNTINHFIRMEKEQGIKTMAKELEEIGVEEGKIREAITKAKKEIQK